MGAHIVAVTDKSVLSYSVRPWSAGGVSNVIPLMQINGVETRKDSFVRIDGGGVSITLKACPPPQVEALVGEIRQKTP